jgi:hypothetical protein
VKRFVKEPLVAKPVPAGVSISHDAGLVRHPLDRGETIPDESSARRELAGREGV